MLQQINTLLTTIRPDAVSLCDAFNWRDSQLDSTLGREDGSVYEAIYEQAKKSPLNQSETMLGWEDFSQVIDLEFLRDGMRTQRAGTTPVAIPTTGGQSATTDSYGVGAVVVPAVVSSAKL